MTTAEFERAVLLEFRFLVDEYSCSHPIIASNASEYRDRAIYLQGNAAIEVLNAWHPSDYGFEINFYPDKSRIDTAGDDLSARDMVYYRLKEDQDDHAQFVRDGATALRKYMKSKSTG